jgi:pyrrolidone-carboxylate peptidase
MSSTDENVDQLKEFIFKNRRTTIHILGISFSCAETILKESLNIHHTASIFMCCLLSEKQKISHVSICQNIQESSKDPNSF